MSVTTHRSVSQVESYSKCPYRYYLERVDRAWQRPAAWLPQGSAFHEAVEAWERSGRSMLKDRVKEIYGESYAKHVAKMTESTPNFEYWFPSGPYKGETDLERRFKIGLDQLDGYFQYYEEVAPDEVVWVTDDGEAGIELEFDVRFGDVPVRGFIDLMVLTASDPPDEPRPRDNKTGNQPGGPFQLATYGSAIGLLHDVWPVKGDYWMARKGKPTKPYDLSEWPLERLIDIYGEADEAIRQERFDPDPDPDKCRFCSVATSCEFAVG